MAKPAAFPEAFIWDIASYLGDNLDPQPAVVLRRPLKPTDPNQAIGVTAETWVPRKHQIGQHAPVVQEYEITIWALAKHVDEEQGASDHSVLGRNVRRILAEDPNLRALLASNLDDNAGQTERFQQLRVEEQRFYANQVSSSFLFLSTTTVKIETENI